MDNSVRRLTDMVPAVDLSARDRMALLVIDMQYHDASPQRGLTLALEKAMPGSMRYYSERLENTTVPAIRSLLDLFRAEELPVVHLMVGSEYRDLRDCNARFRNWTRNLERLTGAEDIWWAGNPDYAIIEELAPVGDETVIKKTATSAFNGSRLDDVMQCMGLSTLVITGVVTSACVNVTALDAVDRGYDCVIVDEATADYDRDTHETTLRTFALHFGRVVATSKELMQAVQKGKTI